MSKIFSRQFARSTLYSGIKALKQVCDKRLTPLSSLLVYFESPKSLLAYFILPGFFCIVKVHELTGDKALAVLFD